MLSDFCFAKIQPMEKREVEWIVRGLSKPGKSKSGLARAIGRSPSAITDLLSGSRQLKASEIPTIAAYLEVAPSEALLPNDAPPTPPANATIRGPIDLSATRERIPVYGQAIGGPDGRFVFNGNRIDDVFAPPMLRNVRDAYAVFVVGESMEPRYRAGEIAYIHPHLPVRRGDFVVVQIRGDDGDAPSGYIKEFVSKGGGVLRLHQLNPPSEMEFAESDVVSVHKIILAG